MKADRTSKITLVKNWLLEGNSELTDIASDLDLIENRIIDSLQFVEFLLFLEEITGKDILASDISVDAFRSLNMISKSFLKDTEYEE